MGDQWAVFSLSLPISFMALFPVQKVWQAQGFERRERGGKHRIKPVWAIPPKLEREGSRDLSCTGNKPLQRDMITLLPSPLVTFGPTAVGIN